MSTKLDRLSELAKEDPKRRFFSIAHLITPEAMNAAFRGLRKNASAGVDGVTYEEYEQDAERNIRRLQQRLKDGKYQAQPLRRVYIPKENGKQRPISIPVLEDKIVQKATVEVLNAIYEQDFLDCSYGFRPGRGQHQALEEVGRVICTRSTGWILELDITAYFDSIVREQLMEMIEQRISDSSVLRLIRKWIQVGVIDEGKFLESETGTGQGQTISPLLANIYLHHVLDQWFEEVVKPRLRSEAHEIRFADDAILCFHYREDAEKGEERISEAVREIRFDAASGEDKAGGIWALCRGTCEEAGEETQHLRLSRADAHLRTQPKREVHRASANDAQAAPQEPHGGRRMVSGEPACPGGRAAENPQCQAPGPLSVLRATHELPVSRAVLSGHLQTLVQVAQSPNARVAADVGEL
jgi:group II intron reverse transcriptase/maturase